MSDIHKRSDLIAFAREHSRAQTDFEEMIVEANRRFPGLTVDRLRQAFEVADREIDHENQERLEAHAQEAAFMEQMGRMFEGLPSTITFEEAVEIKAAEGDQWAIGYLAFEKSPARRIYCALAEAAYAAHPQFKRGNDGVIRWLGDGGADPSEAAMIDWFQKQYPARAREIEREIEKETPQ
jgi:hypothetical protein